MDLIFNFLSMIVIYKSSIHDKRYLDVNLIISVIKSTFGMPKLHYLVSLYFWFVAFIIHYDTVFGRYLAKEEANRLAKEKANQNAKNEANRLAREKANQNAKNEANRLAKEKANQNAKFSIPGATFRI